MHCLTILAPNGDKIEIHMLNVGDHFAGFGGSSHGLTVNTTASMIVRRHSRMGTVDVEYDIDSPTQWAGLAQMFNDPNATAFAVE